MSVVDDLKAARDAIETKGWCQRQLRIGQRMCAVGALNLLCNGGYAYQVFIPPDKRVDQDDDGGTTLHLYGRVDGEPMLPEFGN